jgi:hypothetical protein
MTGEPIAPLAEIKMAKKINYSLLSMSLMSEKLK